MDTALSGCLFDYQHPFLNHVFTLPELVKVRAGGQIIDLQAYCVVSFLHALIDYGFDPAPEHIDDGQVNIAVPVQAELDGCLWICRIRIVLFQGKPAYACRRCIRLPDVCRHPQQQKKAY